MVGRELPKVRPNGEDHRGAGGGIHSQRATRMISMILVLSRRWKMRTTTRRIRKELMKTRVLLLPGVKANDFLAILYSLQE